MRAVVLAALLLIALVSLAVADKTTTFFTATLTDVDAVWFQRDSSAPSGWAVRAHANIRASAGPSYAATISGPASAGQKTAIENFITNNVVPALNTQEGL